MKAVYLEATLTFLRFAAKQYSIAQLFGGSYQLYAAICPHIPNSAEGNCLTEKENHIPCLKSDIKEKNCELPKYDSEKQSRLGSPCF